MLDSEDTFTQDAGGGEHGAPNGPPSPRTAATHHGPRAESDLEDGSGSDGEAKHAAAATRQGRVDDELSAVVVSLEDVRGVQPPAASSPAAYGFEYGSPFGSSEVVSGLVCTAWMPALNRHVRAVVNDVHAKSLEHEVCTPTATRTHIQPTTRAFAQPASFFF